MTDGSKLVGVAALQEQEETALAVRLFFVGFLWSLRGSVLPAALLDRLTHHVHILEMNGESYRLKRSRENAAPPLPAEPDDA